MPGSDLTGPVTMRSRSISSALVPLRLFLGGTFLYAGVDKLVSPTFFVASAPGSIQEQLTAFARTSPLGPLLHAVMPVAALVGFLIAVAEIGIGLGALSGFGFRVAAVGGAGLAGLFWLTASWATRPYYYGPDLPYLLGWITLALAGHGNVLVPDRFRIPEPAPAATGRRRRQPPAPTTGQIARRALLEAGVLAAAATAVAMVSSPFKGVLGLGTSGGSDPTPTPRPEPSPTDVVGTPIPGLAVAALADLAATGAVAFRIPFTAPLPLPAGDPGVIVALTDGTYAAFDAVCTHAGCTVEWDRADRLLVCPCHGAVFDPARAGVPVEGPTSVPLAGLPIALDPSSGTFVLRTSA